MHELGFICSVTKQKGHFSVMIKVPDYCASDLGSIPGQVNFFTAHVRSTREGTVFKGVCLSILGGGVPHPTSGQGIPYSQTRTGAQGYPIPRSELGTPPIQVRSQIRTGVPQGTPTKDWIRRQSSIANTRYASSIHA